MATDVWKDVLYPTRQRDQHGNWFGFTRRDTARACRNVIRMVQRGLRIPAVWEHQSAAEPVSLSRDDRVANYVKNSFGEITGAKVDARGVLWLKHHIYEDADARRLAARRVQCSPKVYPGYSDSRGGEYRGTTIGHVAATPTPVQFWQKPFRLLSQHKALYLSYAEPTMADENDTKPADDEKGGDDFGAKKGGGKAAELNDLIEALRGKGFTISEKVSSLKELTIAVESSNASAGGDDLDDDDLDPPENLDDAPNPDAGPDATQPGGAPPMLMSDKRAEPLKGMVRRDMSGRINKLFTSGRIDKPTAKRLLQEAGTVQLSFTRDAQPRPNRVLQKIEAYEELDRGLVWSKKGGKRPTAAELSDTRAEGPPASMVRGGRGDANLKPVVDFMCADLPEPAKK